MDFGLKIIERNLIKFVMMAKGKNQKVCMMMMVRWAVCPAQLLYVIAAVDDVDAWIGGWTYSKVVYVKNGACEQTS